LCPCFVLFHGSCESQIALVFPCSTGCDHTRLLDILKRLVTEVGIVEGGVVPTAGEELAVIALLYDPAVLHHNDAVSGLDRR